jgi:RHS repeat-associated protein
MQQPISATNNSPKTTYYGYAGRTSTVQDFQGHTTTKISQVTGKLGRTIDAYGYYVNLTYDAAGSLLSATDSASNTLMSATYAYGIKPFQTYFSDMDLGTRTYTVDPLGEVTAYTDSNGNSFSTTYDALSRPHIRTEPDLTTTWTWGNSAGSYNIGKLQQVTAASSLGTYQESYTFDNLTRPLTTVITIPGDASYTYSFSYDPTTEMLGTLTYPQGPSGYQLKLQYGYTNGILASVTDANTSTAYWTANSINPMGQVAQETLGNGVVTNRSFDAVTGWLGNIEAGVGGGAALQNNAFTYYEMGNVSQRQDNNQGLTENFYYDNDYRLTSSTLNGTQNLSITYDATSMGNIATRSDIGGGTTWTYDSVRKHAVTQSGTGGYSFTYDGNGNALTRNGYSNTWTSYNYPSGVNSSGESAQFYYGQNHQRIKTVYEGSIGTEITYHVGRSLEKVVYLNGSTDWRYYIKAGNELVGIYSTTAGAVRYVLGDHQAGFASIVAGSTPSILVSESFTAFGNRRSGETWSGAPSNPDETAINSVSRWGYTGQTVLGVSMGLNHMNGRVEDAITGRFLSPDPNIPNPGNTQSYNRYSYVINNPLTYVDPTGFDEDVANPDDGGGGGGGGYGGGYGSGGSGSYDGEVPPITVQCTVCCGSDSGCWPTLPPSQLLPGDVQPFFPPLPPRPPTAPNKPPAQSPKRQGCINRTQIGVGAVQAAFGTAQTVGGAIEVFFGVAGAPETFGAATLAIGPGLANVGMGALAFNDGVNLLMTGLGGPSSGTTLGEIGQSIGGNTGGFLGDVANLIPGVIALATDVNAGTPFIVDGLLTLSNLVSGNSTCP